MLTFNYASGQSYQIFQSQLEQIKERARWHIGPFRIYPTIQLRNIGYDNNVYYQREEDDPISDYTATISPELNVYLLFRDIEPAIFILPRLATFLTQSHYLEVKLQFNPLKLSQQMVQAAPETFTHLDQRLQNLQLTVATHPVSCPL